MYSIRARTVIWNLRRVGDSAPSHSGSSCNIARLGDWMVRLSRFRSWARSGACFSCVHNVPTVRWRNLDKWGSSGRISVSRLSWATVGVKMTVLIFGKHCISSFSWLDILLSDGGRSDRKPIDEYSASLF